MSIFQRIEDAKKLWSLMLRCPVPEDQQLARWLVKFEDGEFEFAVSRASQKFRQLRQEPEQIGRYITGVLVNERRQAEGEYV